MLVTTGATGITVALGTAAITVITPTIRPFRRWATATVFLA